MIIYSTSKHNKRPSNGNYYKDQLTDSIYSEHEEIIIKTIVMIRNKPVYLS